MRRDILKHWPLGLIIITFIWDRILWLNVTPGDEFAIGIITLFMALPFCGVVSGLWYGYLGDFRSRWSILVVQFATIALFLLSTNNVIENLKMTDIYDLIMCIILTIPCACATFVGYGVKCFMSRNDKSVLEKGEIPDVKCNL